MLSLSNLPSSPIAVGDNSLTAIVVSGTVNGTYSYNVDGELQSSPTSESVPITIVIPGGNHVLSVTDGTSTVQVTIVRDEPILASLTVCTDPLGNVPLVSLDLPGTFYIKVVGTSQTFKNVSLVCAGLQFTPSAIELLPEGITPVLVEVTAVPIEAGKTSYAINFHCETWWEDTEATTTILPLTQSIAVGDQAVFQVTGTGSLILNNQVCIPNEPIVIPNLPAGTVGLKIWSSNITNTDSVQVTVYAQRAIVRLGDPITVEDFGEPRSITAEINGIEFNPPCPSPNLLTSTALFNTAKTIPITSASILQGAAEFDDATLMADITYPAVLPTLFPCKKDVTYGVIGNTLYKTSDGFGTWDVVLVAPWSITSLDQFGDFWVFGSNNDVYIAPIPSASWSHVTIGYTPVMVLGDAIVLLSGWTTTDGINWASLNIISAIDAFYADGSYLFTGNGPTITHGPLNSQAVANVPLVRGIGSTPSAVRNIVKLGTSLFAQICYQEFTLKLIRSDDNGATWTIITTVLPGDYRLKYLTNSSPMPLLLFEGELYATPETVWFYVLFQDGDVTQSGLYNLTLNTAMFWTTPGFGLSTYTVIGTFGDDLIGQHIDSGQIYKLTDTLGGWILC